VLSELCDGLARVHGLSDQQHVGLRADNRRRRLGLLDKAKFPAAFAGDVSPEAASFMANSQVPWGLEALNGAVTEAAWRTKPSSYLVSTEDKMIPPDAQRIMAKRAGATGAEVKGRHAVYVSQPQAVAHRKGGRWRVGRKSAAGELANAK
jgi:hypothetical protein